MDIIKDHRPCIILDLDETIVHTQECEDTGALNIYFRPGLKIFLTELSESFNFMVYTAGGSTYADIVVGKIHELCEKVVIKHYLSSENMAERVID